MRAASGRYMRRSAAISVMTGMTNVGDNIAKTKVPKKPVGTIAPKQYECSDSEQEKRNSKYARFQRRRDIWQFVMNQQRARPDRQLQIEPENLCLSKPPDIQGRSDIESRGPAVRRTHREQHERNPGYGQSEVQRPGFAHSPASEPEMNDRSNSSTMSGAETMTSFEAMPARHARNASDSHTAR